MNPPPSLQPGDLVRLVRTTNVRSARMQELAERVLVQPQRLGKVGEVYHELSTGCLHARVYWQVGETWYAVNLPVANFTKA